jgi:hypothetical protein
MAKKNFSNSTITADSIMSNMVQDTPANALVPIEDGYKLFDVVIHDTGIVFPNRMSLEDWEELGRYILRLDTALTWALVDWIIYGQDHQWGETYQQLANEFGLKVDSLYIYVSEARKIFIRNKDLSFAHHRAVARLPEHRQAFWLQSAVENQWTVAQLKARISPSRDDGTDRIALTRKMFQGITKTFGKVGRSKKLETADVEKALTEIEQVRRWLEEAEQAIRNASE